jgi:hypothetical protein
MPISIDSIKYILINLLTINLEYRNKAQDNLIQPRFILLNPVIDELITQKTMEWDSKCILLYKNNVLFENIWLIAAPYDLKNKISNLLNNAFEALNFRGHT